MSITSPLYFIHIPKTAGSSFRVAAERYFGTEATYYDYGAGAQETHQDILKYEYQLKDRHMAGRAVQQHAKFLSGHFIYPKYAPFFPARSVVTFVRNPAQQVRSHYEHFSRLHGYEGSFADFIRERRFANMQSKALNGIWHDAIGFIGITEQFSESLKVFNQYYGTSVEFLEINKNERKNQHAYQLSAEELALIQKMNQQDFALYEYALKRFERQKHALQNDVPFVRSGHLHVDPKDKGRQFNGWAACFEQEEAITANVVVNEQIVDQTSFASYRPLAKERAIHRNGYVGLSYRYADNIEAGSTVKFICRETEQVLFEDTAV
ncbi:sulfotransferase family 2 domain-containing protein [Alteromonas sp. ASW11-19]|uniref:Sulfotransferase family 2 domain-containing protein n=1 Tax=Alteromonas salexigens TaxID=2982530 RepID=A0ABT2VMB1_9ALTE|nr:sulfotransferase family 2 domain-containing protein [Alteromonas salexigens]MCU7554455.1 sulfotransferase family 2 domain-containing protein [Alteromonas salexigens]